VAALRLAGTFTLRQLMNTQADDALTKSTPDPSFRASVEKLDATAMFSWLSKLNDAQVAEEIPPSHASPPCYLAEFDDLDA